MAAENSRIAELRRRVQEDPASIAFAQLAEEYRRLGEFNEAVKYCRSGLARHPGYLSARVTLGRALIGLGAWAAAEAELDVVLRSAPDNVVALRAMAEVHQNRGDGIRAREYQQRAFAHSHPAPDLEDIAVRIDREIAASSQSDAVRDPVRSARALEPLLDFDALLASFGVPNAAPPPLLESMLSGSPARFEKEAWTAEAPETGAHEDVFSVLERQLRAFEEGNALNAGAAPVSDVKPLHVSDEGLGELEAWLQALADERTRSAP